MGREFLGYSLGRDTTEDFLSKIGTVDPLGENGEYHTLVLECPLYPKSFKAKSIEKGVEKSMAYMVVSVE